MKPKAPAEATQRKKPPLHNREDGLLQKVQFCPINGVGEDAWLDVIRKMDEVYSGLIEYEVALEEKNTELEETHQFLYSVMTSMSDILIVCDRYGHVQDVNNALARLVGKDSEKLRGKPFVDLFANEASRKMASEFPQRLRDESVHDCEIAILGIDGGEVPVALNCTPRYDLNGRQVGMVMVGRPVGDLRRAFQALREAHEQLKRTQQQLLQSEKMASLGRLVAGVAHELNNPISFVLGNVHAMQRYAGRIKQYLEAVPRCTESSGECARLRKELKIDRIIEDLDPLIDGTIEGAERTRDIVDGLKRFSAPDKDENTIFNLTEVIEKAIHWVTRVTSLHFQVVAENLPRELMVSGAAGQMQQVIINLVQNAFDAAKEKERPFLEIGAHISEGTVRVDFRDNGPGIRNEYLTKVFDPFFTTKPVGKGTGLGLSISYGIVERHGGNLSVTNHPDGGAIFSLQLPLMNSGIKA